MGFLFGTVTGALGGIMTTLFLDKFMPPKLVAVGIIPIPEKWVGSPLSKGVPSSTSQSLEIHSEGRYYSFYCLQVANRQRMFFNSNAEIEKTTMRIFDQEGVDLFSDSKKCRWWSSGDELNNPLFTMDNPKSEKDRIKIPYNSEECIVIAYRPLDQNKFFRFTTESDSRQAFPRLEDMIEQFPCYAIINIRGKPSKDIYLKINTSSYHDGLDIEILSKKDIPFPTLGLNP